MEQFQRGDTAALITYTVMSVENATRKEHALKLIVRNNAQIIKAGAKQVTVKGGFSDMNYPRCDIGKPISGLFRNTFNVLVPKGADTAIYIAQAQDHMRDSIKSTQEKLLAGIDVVKTEAERENEWLQIKDAADE